MKNSTAQFKAMGSSDPEWKALEALVDNFAEAMKVKLQQKLNFGCSGWDDPAWPMEDLLVRLTEHAEKSPTLDNFVDVANFAAFGWNKLQ